jgi:hypothetical protein
VSRIRDIECDADLKLAKFSRADATTLQPAAEARYGFQNLRNGVVVFSSKRLAGATSALELAAQFLPDLVRNHSSLMKISDEF